MPKTQVRKPIEIKISTVVAVAANLRESDLAVLNAAMQDITGGEPDYFDNEFTIIDVGSVVLLVVLFVWVALVVLFRSYRLNPVAVRNAAPGMEAAILAQGLSLDAMPAPRHAPAQQEIPEVQAAIEAAAPAPVSPAAAAAPAINSSKIVDTPKRANQRNKTQRRKQNNTAAVNNGAEVIADGSI